MKEGPAETPLIFEWPRREGFPFAFFGFLLFSLLAHAATFMLFQVVDRRPVTMLQTAPRVGVLTASNADALALLRWVDAEDPALIASSSDLTPPGLTVASYKPSFAIARTRLLAAPAEKPTAIRYPPGRDSLDLVNYQSPITSPAPTQMQVRPTTVTFSESLAQRQPKAEAPLSFVQTASAQPAHWLLGVNGRGEVQFTFLQQTSAEAALDTAAEHYLRRVHFDSSDAPMTWGFATFVWGNERGATNSPALP